MGSNLRFHALTCLVLTCNHRGMMGSRDNLIQILIWLYVLLLLSETCTNTSPLLCMVKGVCSKTCISGTLCTACYLSEGFGCCSPGETPCHSLAISALGLAWVPAGLMAALSTHRLLAALTGRLASSLLREMRGECACMCACARVRVYAHVRHVCASDELLPTLSLSDWDCVWQWRSPLVTPIFQAAYGVRKILVTSFLLLLLMVEQPKPSAFMVPLYVKRSDPTLFAKEFICRGLGRFFLSSCLRVIHLFIVLYSMFLPSTFLLLTP